MIRISSRETALAAIVTLAIVAIVSFAPAPEANRFDGDFHDFGHVLVFGIMGLMIARTSRRAVTPAPARWVVALVALAAGFVFGAGTEYAQGFLGGTPSWGDVGRDMLGTAVGSCAALALERRGGLRVGTAARRVLWIGALSGLVIGGWPLAGTLLDYRVRNALFPVLLDPAEPRSLSFTAPFNALVRVEPLPPGLRELDGRPAAAGSPAIRVALDHGPWPGLTLAEPVYDWRDWRALVVDLANPTDAPLRIELRVNDRAHDNQFFDRFNRGYDLPARTRGRIEIPVADIELAPKGRRMDLSEIKKVVIFHDGPLPGRAFYVGRVSLAH